MKRKGEWLRARAMLRSGQLQAKDLGFLARRALHLLLASRGM